MRLTRAIIAVLTVGLTLLLSGCSFSWIDSINPFSRGTPRNLPADLVEFEQIRSVTESWSLNVGSSDNFIFTPVATYDSIYAASAKGTIVRVDPQTGSEVWRIDAGIPLTAGVGTDGHTIVVAGKNGVLLAFDSDGKEKWKAQMSSEALSAPAVGGDMVVVRTLDNHISGFEADSGERKWMVTRRAPPLMLRSAPGIAIVGPTAIVALPGGRMISLMLANGGTNWDVVVGDPRGTTDLERIADTSGMPAVLGRLVCAASFQGRVACYDVVSGGGVWAKELSSDVGVSVDDDFVYAADEAGAVYAFVNLRGQSVWRNERLAYRALSTPVSFERTVAVGDLQGYVHFLSKEDGGFISRTATDGSAIKATPLVVGEKLIIQTTGGRLLALMIN
ncbi:outer membrane protein assembly factor BamB [Oxalobacter vibrioformis]|uniref:Outer membrane protein assembly factor BamB n=1 Tax=Oxalobacter vibrioformis TaxID=933080 RepID=A0A9E9M160_9BURK|nr:outer membrane protein assembly factor BamB [Oxalobacter vibrioformis]WAW10628.1 outer membrane protein assembly factor BamB [Oxalobacter vibrioformis]